jgi:peptidoglycan/xylan/chitin deacetylase (PgdA/CDA1 family)
VTARHPVIALVLTVATAATAGAAVVIALGRSDPADRPVHAAASPRPTASPAPTAGTVEVNGAVVPAAGSITVGEALDAAGVTLRPGAYLAVVSQRRLTPDGEPAKVLVDGHPATLGTIVSDGERITTQSGPDLVEPTETVRQAVPPPVPSALYVGGRDGIVRIVRGAMSHEEISRRMIRRPVAGHLVERGAVALTFDDGPDPVWTRRVLAMLGRHHVKATFCMIGRAVDEHPRMVRKVASRGHALCDHTYDHDLTLRSQSRERIRGDIAHGARVITKWSDGVRPTFFRAPGGKWSSYLEEAARAQGMTPLAWTADPEDWRRPGVKSIVRTVLQELRPGGVVLLHDGGGRRGQTLEALRVLLHRLPRLGYHFVLPPSPEPAAEPRSDA